MTKKIVQIVYVFILSCVMLVGQSDGNSRADARFGSEFYSNPAAWAFDQSFLTVGMYSDVDVSKISDFSLEEMPYTFLLNSPLLNFSYSRDVDDNVRYSFGSSFSAAPYFAFGYRTVTDKSSDDANSYDLGLILRPNGLLSLGMTYENAFTDSALFGFGVAARPLIFLGTEQAPMLTVSADMVYDNAAFSFQNLALRYAYHDLLSIKAWYDWDSQKIGAGLTVKARGSSNSVAVSDVQNPSQLRYGTTASVNLYEGQTLPPMSKAVLHIDGNTTFLDTPYMATGFFAGSEAIAFDVFIQAIEKAASDPRIQALVLQDPAAPTSLAKAQELGRALSQFRDTGKPIYVYAKRLNSTAYIYLSALAEYIGLDIYGSVALVDTRLGSVYFRGLADKLGLRFYPVRSHDYKSAGNPLTEYGMTEAEQEMYERLVFSMAEQNYRFLDTARKDKLVASAADIIAQGPYLTSKSALEAGLIDEILFEDEFWDFVIEQSGTARSIGLADYMMKAENYWGERPFAKTVAVVHLNGNILEGPGVAGQSIGFRAVSELRALREGWSTSAVILRVDSGGGSALASEHIAREVKLTVEAGIPVYVSMSGYAASGGYYISAPATKIYAEEGTLTGSIGVLGFMMEATELLEKIGVNFDTVSASQSADFADPFQKMRQEDADRQREMLLYIYDRFLDVVAEGRNMEKNRVDELGQGQIWLGSEALENGLIDAIGGLSQVKEDLAAELGGHVIFKDIVPGLAPSLNLTSLLLPVLAPEMKSLQASSLFPASWQASFAVLDELEQMGQGPLMLLPDYLWQRQFSLVD